MTTSPWEPVPVPQGDGWHDIGDDARAAIVRRLMEDWSRDPDLTPEKVRQMATWAGASVRALLHELGTLRDLAGESNYIPERDGRRCVEHPKADHELVCLMCLESKGGASLTVAQEGDSPPWRVAAVSITEQLRIVWNLRGAMDIAAIEEVAHTNETAVEAAIERLDR